MKFVERLKELMQEREISSKQLACDTGIDPTSISKWLTFATIVS